MSQMSLNHQKPYANVERGYYIISPEKRLFFRSKMEANFALYLEFLLKRGDIISWRYEPKTFVFEKILYGTRSYRPDFEVIEANGRTVYWECKGYMDRKSQTKLKRMRIYFPEVTVKLFDNKQYTALKKWKNLLKFY